tara:strand:+ start:1821 stop:2414 length:594 start_codon:yes stop_codon:yes gene_type:complete
MRTLSIVSGGFDPVHIGHLELFEKAKSISDDVLAIINTDDFLIKKKGKPFMLFNERIKIIQALKPIGFTFKSIDTDQTVCASIKAVHKSYSDEYDKIIFCNGGDRTNGENTPEHKTCEEIGIETVYGLGDKIQSSSWLINEEGETFVEENIHVTSDIVHTKHLGFEQEEQNIQEKENRRIQKVVEDQIKSAALLRAK